MSLLSVCVSVSVSVSLCLCVCVCVFNSLCFVWCAGVLLSPQPLQCEHAYFCMKVFYAPYKSFSNSFSPSFVSGAEGEGEESEKEDSSDRRLPTGRVVGVLSRQWRDYVASLPPDEVSDAP